MEIIPIAVLAAVIVLTISWNCYRICFHSPQKRRPTPYDPIPGPQFVSVRETVYRVIGIMERYSYEDAQVTAWDGTDLRGRYYHFRDGAPVMLLCHGYRSAALRDCCGGHALARRLGFNALVIHQRAQGESGGKTITFGIRERRDLFDWLEYIARRCGEETPVILSGLSMGAATVLMGCALGYPKSVACIIADSPYSSPGDIIRKVCQDLHYPRALYPFVYLGALIFGGFRLNQSSAAEAVRHARQPVLLIHGTDDRLVPWEMSSRIASANPQYCRLLTIPGAGHGLSYMTDPEAYEKAFMDFLAAIPALSPWLDMEMKKL